MVGDYVGILGVVVLFYSVTNFYYPLPFHSFEPLAYFSFKIRYCLVGNPGYC